MKKIIKIVILSIILIINDKVFASSFYDAEFIPNVYIHKVENGKIRYQQGRVLRENNTNRWVYCIEPWKTLINNTAYTNRIIINNYNDDIYKKINLIANYGYGYKNHTDLKWYYITQVLIWREIEPNSKFYFTDKLNGKKTSKYDNEMNEIINLVNNHSIKPNLNNNYIKLGLNEEINIIDHNNVLENYEIQNYDLFLKHDNNKIYGKANKTGEFSIALNRKNYLNNEAIVFTHNNSQSILLSGIINESLNINIEVVSGKIKIIKKSNNKKDYNFKGTKFNIYKDNIFVKEIKLEDNNMNLENLELGTYKIKEISPIEGFELNNNEYSVTIDKNKLNHQIEIVNNRIEKQIKLTKYYGFNDNWKKEADIMFNIYDEKNNLVKEIKTDSNGEVSFKLDYGKYRFVQINTKENYKKVEDFYVEVMDSNEIEIVKYNNVINIDKPKIKVNVPDTGVELYYYEKVILYFYKKKYNY